MDLTEVEDWVRSHLGEVLRLEAVHERPWATVFRVALADGVRWVKVCAPVQGFEPRLTAANDARPEFDKGFRVVLRRALRRTLQ